MVYLSITDDHLLCAQWFIKDGKPLLSSISYKKLQRPLDLLECSSSEIISIINAGLQLIREDISFEGQDVYVTIPDQFTETVYVAYDQDMTDNDGWAFARWTLNQRYPSDEKFEYFGRSFSNKTGYVYAQRVPAIFTEPIKMAIQELGGVAFWMGTESSVFYGLNPEKGCTIFQIEKTGYNYHHYSSSGFYHGSARFIKGDWRLNAINGSNNSKDVFKGQLFVAGKLSEKRISHFKGQRIKQLISLKGINIEGNIFDKSLHEEDLYTFTALATGSVKGVALNFFDQPGFQSFTYQKPKDDTAVKRTKNKMDSTNKKRIKIVKKKQQGNRLKALIYIFFIGTISVMLVYDQNPQIFNEISAELYPSNSKPTLQTTQSDISLKDISDQETSQLTIDSQGLIASALKIFQLIDSKEIRFLSMSDQRMDLELLGNKIMDAPIDSVGEILNYSLRQLAGDDRFEHGYLVRYYSLSQIEQLKEQSLDDLKLTVDSLGQEQSFYRSLDPIEKSEGMITPVIVRLFNDDLIKNLLNHISEYGQNIFLEKFVFKGETELIQPSAIFYISHQKIKQAKPRG